jgi:D-amino-acid dehydrogenase
MRIAVLGAGVVGITTAYYLAERGYSVTVFDSARRVADATSHANGAQLSYSYTDAMAQPAFVPTIPGLILGRDSAVRVRLSGNLGLLPWGVRFLAQCTSRRARENTLAVLEISLRSAHLLAELQDRLGLEFSHRVAGKLVLLPSEAAMEEAGRRADIKRGLGCETRVITRSQAMEIEPALAAVDDGFVGAVYSETDEVGDPLEFSYAVAAWLLENRPVTLRLGEQVTGLCKTGNRVTGVMTSQGRYDFDACVVCLGPWSAGLLQPLGINPGICPVRGYSLSLPAGRHALRVSVTSLRHRMVFTRLGEDVRIAGFADFVGFDTGDDSGRTATLLRTAQQLAPEAADYRAPQSHPWGGFRAMTPSGRPRVGATPIPGLFLNTGHGMLGWTLACATGHDVAQAISAG